MVGQNPKDARYGARRYLWAHSAAPADQVVNPGLRRCGRVMREDTVKVKVSEAAGIRHAGYGGLVTCGSAWSCPVCSAKIAARRASEISQALGTWTARGGTIALLTLTMRHHAKRDGLFVLLAVLWGGLAAAWHLLTAGRAWKDLQAAYGAPMERTIRSGKRKGETVQCLRIRTIRVVEVTHGRHGWHPHLHVLLLLPALKPGQLESLGLAIATRWADALTSLGFERVSDETGTDIRPLTGAEIREGFYLTKGSRYVSTDALAAEVAFGSSKKGRKGSRAPFQILDTIRVAFDTVAGSQRSARRDRALWVEWEQASRGRRQIAWSAGLREDLKVEILDDQEAAELDNGGDVVAEIEAAVWHVIAARHMDYAVLRSFESSYAEGVALVTALSCSAGDSRPHRKEHADGGRHGGFVSATAELLLL